MFTTHLTHGRSRSPLRRYGRHIAATRLTPLQQLCCCRLLFKSDGFTGSSCPLRLSYLKIPVETITAPYTALRYRFLLYPKREKMSRENPTFPLFSSFSFGGAQRRLTRQHEVSLFSCPHRKRCELPFFAGGRKRPSPPLCRFSSLLRESILKMCCFVKHFFNIFIAKIALFSCEKIDEMAQSPCKKRRDML